MMKNDSVVLKHYKEIVGSNSYDPKAVTARLRYIAVTDAQRAVKLLTVRCGKQR